MQKLSCVINKSYACSKSAEGSWTNSATLLGDSLLLTANSKNLGSRASCNLSFFEGHLTPASKPFESPTSAKGATSAKNAAESELELSKQVAMPTKKCVHDARD